MLTLLMLFAAATAAAQERFSQFARRNPWNAGANAAGIRQDTVGRSFAEVYFTKENGGMTDRSSSDDSWNAGARTASVRHLEKVSFAGGFSYDYFDGRNMSGSMFTLPGYYPVDIVEFTPGRKIRETYAFTGGLSAVLGRRWTAGLKADFTARNYAKRRDLRHKNTRLDFECAPGLLYHAGRFAAGAAYIVGINTEKLEAEGLGAGASNIEAFFDRGLRFGSLRPWESNELHLTTAGVSGFPVRERTQGAAVQLQYGALYADVAYRNRTGETGERGTLWHAFATDRVTARAVLTCSGGEWNHCVRLTWDWESLSNRENILTYETVNGVSNPHIHGSVPVFGRKSLSAEGEYELADAKNDLRVRVGYAELDRESTLMYPYVRGQKLHHAFFRVAYLRHLGRWELTLAADFRKGGFREREERFDSPSTPGEYPQRLTDCYDWENEYATAPRAGFETGVRRSIRRFYVELAVRCEHGFDLRYLPEAERFRATLCAGYNF